MEEVQRILNLNKSIEILKKLDEEIYRGVEYKDYDLQGIIKSIEEVILTRVCKWEDE